VRAAESRPPHLAGADVEDLEADQTICDFRFWVCDWRTGGWEGCGVFGSWFWVEVEPKGELNVGLKDEQKDELNSPPSGPWVAQVKGIGIVE